MSQFTDPEIEILSELLRKRAHMGDLIFRILHNRHNLPEWMHQAQAAKWEPHRDWRKEEREEIGNTVRSLIDRHWVGIGGPWDLYANITELELIARQAR